VGLKSDGTVVAVRDNGSGQGSVDGWSDVIQLTTGTQHTVGLKSDGSVVAAGLVGLVVELAEWNLLAPTP